MKHAIPALASVALLSCLAACATKRPADESWSLVDYLDPDRPVPARVPDEVLSQIPQRMLKLRAGMTTAAFWQSLGLSEYRLRLPFHGTAYWHTQPWWETLDVVSERFEIHVKLTAKPQKGVTGIRIREKGADSWIVCEFAEQEKSQQPAGAVTQESARSAAP